MPSPAESIAKDDPGPGGQPMSLRDGLGRLSQVHQPLCRVMSSPSRPCWVLQGLGAGEEASPGHHAVGHMKHMAVSWAGGGCEGSGQRGESGTTGHLLWGFLPSLEQKRLEALPTEVHLSKAVCVCDGGVRLWTGLNSHV